MPTKHHRRSDRIHQDKRNDTGLAAPGKKIFKRTSNGYLNGAVNGQISPPQDNPISPHDSAWSSARACPAATSRAAPADSSYDSQDQSSYFPSTDPDTDVPTPSPMRDNHDSWLLGQRPRADTMDSKIDLPLAGEVAPSTVIRARSLRDVIATLLLLLQLPPYLLMAVQSTFVLLTLGCSPASNGLSSLFSIGTWFHNKPGESAIGTALVLDAFFMFGFIWLPAWAKDLALDLSQAVIAISLGGGSASQGTFSIATAIACMSLVGCRHVFRQELPRRYLVNLIATASSNFDQLPDYVSAYIQDLTRYTTRSHDFLRVWLEVHIIVQGVFRIIRRSMQGAASATVRRTDSEIIALHNSSVNNASNDPSVDGNRSSSTDGRPPGLPPAAREVAPHKGGSSSKRRRKQATFVRSQQPFWAAIASTKVTVSKEFEQSEAQRDQFEAGDVSLEKMGGMSGKEVDDRGWIRQVNDTEVDFEVKILGLRSDPSEASDDNVSRIVIVRVNGADWGSTNLTPRQADNGKDMVLVGRITGLTPSTNYEVEFVRASNDKVIGDAAIFTRPVASIDPVTILPAASGGQAQRPLSPTSTLKQSIAAVDSRLSDIKAKSKKTRKDHRSAINQLQKDVIKDTEKLKTSSTTDSRQKSREIQFQHNIRQAEESAVAIAEEIVRLGEIPVEETRAYSAKKQDFKKARQEKSALTKQHDEIRKEGEQCLAEVQHENASVSQKREKFDSKILKFEERKRELDNEILEVKRAQEAARNLKTMNRGVLRDIQRKQEFQWNEQIARFESDAANYRYQTASLEQQISQQNSEPAPNFAPPGFNVPMTGTPESTFAQVSGPPRQHNYSPFGQQQQQFPIGTPPVASRRGSVARARNRKSSMLSDASGLTDEVMGNGDDDWHDTAPGRNNSDDSGSGSLAAHSTMDTASPIAPARLSPIGTKVGSAFHATPNKYSPRNGNIAP